MTEMDLLRKGKWTPEEENYANVIIHLFNQGRLTIEPGTTLRSLLSDKLKCDPMRITKKYAGESSIGKQIFHPSETFMSSEEDIREVEQQLCVLEKAFLKRINSKQSMVDEDGHGSSLRSSQRASRNREKPAEYADYYTAENLDSLDVFVESGHRRRSTQNGDRNSTSSPTFKSESGPKSGRNSGRSGRDKSASPEATSFVTEGTERVTLVNMVNTETGQSVVAEQKFSPYHKVDKSQASSSSQKSSSRRSFSAPNLSTLEQYPSEFSFPPSVGQTNVPNIPSYTLQELNAHPQSMHKRKRSYSSMALMDFEKLVDDDGAADSLFVEFVTAMHEIKRSRTQSNAQVVADATPVAAATVTPVTTRIDSTTAPKMDVTASTTSAVSVPTLAPTTSMTTAAATMTPVQPNVQQQQQQQQSWLYVNLPHSIFVQPQTVTVATVTPNPSASQGHITTGTISPPTSLVNAQVAHIIPSPVLTTSQQQQLHASQQSSQFHQQWYALPLPISSGGVLPNAVIAPCPDWMFTNPSQSLQSLPSSSRENSDLHLDVHLREATEAPVPTYKDKHLPSSSASSLSSTSSHVIPSDDEAGISF